MYYVGIDIGSISTETVILDGSVQGGLVRHIGHRRQQSNLG